MITLVLGGARSGKSDVAERLVATMPEPVVYLATIVPRADDDDLTARVAAHRDRRPASWKTVEAGARLAEAVRDDPSSTLLIDSLGPWVGAHDGFAVDIDALVRSLCERRANSVVVSEEVGLGVHPSTAEGRRFRDALGNVNRAIADVADRVLLVVAGRVLPLESPASDS